jgi:AhpD family alkylhydroperoxidase
VIHDAGPIDKKQRELIKLAMAIGAGLGGGTQSHVRRALEEGVTSEEIFHVVFLGITTLGFPRTVAALTWVEEVLGQNSERAKGKRR